MSPPTSAVADDLVRTLRSAGCVFAEDEADLLLAAAHGPAELSELTGRRVAGEPLEQVLGWAEFCGLRIAVAPGVFVPRRRTAFLVECAVDLIRPDGKVGTLSQPGQPSRRVALQRRSVRDCLAEELRRLDPDEVYAAALKSLSKVAKGRAPSSKPEEAAAEASANGKAAAPAKKPKAKASS
jgi:hypothetical protein